MLYRARAFPFIGDERLHYYTIKPGSNVDNIQEAAIYFINRVHDSITSTRGREILLFLVFSLSPTYSGWLLTLNNEVQEDLEVPITLTNVPDSVTLISDVPPSLKVSVRDKRLVACALQLGRSADNEKSTGTTIATHRENSCSGQPTLTLDCVTISAPTARLSQ
ncbi:hypothetical protein [Muribaculum gordoncarteri]|uniref:hypothetical protein n=1 Tax=Muribaculum gordoncarteri TaxID=2530390 RepID=UPI003F67A7FA